MSEPSLFDRLEPGLVIELGEYEFTPENIKAFARRYDSQRFHLDEKAAEESHFGALCASGWHTASVFMRLNVDNSYKALCEATGYDGPVPHQGPSPGIRNLKWRKPVYAGRTIVYRSTVTRTHRSEKRPGWGIVTSHVEAFEKSGGACVLELEGSRFLATGLTADPLG